MSAPDLKVESYQKMFARVKSKNEGAFIPFVVAGDPDFDTSLEIVKTFKKRSMNGSKIVVSF